MQATDWTLTMKTFTLTRTIKAEEDYDVLVAGGGPAGVAAAIVAARKGSRVLLVEATGCLGGMGTSGLVTTFGPMGNGQRTLVGGFALELIQTMYARGLLGPEVTPDYWISHYNRWIPFHPEGLKLLLDEMCVSAGVEVRYFTRVAEAETEGRKVLGAVIHNIEGFSFIAAKTYIDATGDAVLADLCGAECKVAGRDWKHAPATLCSIFGNIDWNNEFYASGNGGTDGAHNRIKKEFLPIANESGIFTLPDPYIAGMKKIGATSGTLNGGHIYNLDGLDIKSLSDGMMYGRRLAQEYTQFYREFVPGCENMEHLATAPVMGLRDTRRIVGEFELTMDDYRARRQFPDQVAVYNRPADVHATDTSREEHERFVKAFEEDGKDKLGVGDSVGIPYSILVPRGSENLWVAGRCHSSDTGVHGSIRAQSAAYMMGEAAATAARQSIETGQPACDLDTRRLVETLRTQNAYLPQEQLSRTMTR
jgi:hypothetical protein